MSLPQTVAEVISKHVTLELECIDRMYLNVYIPRLQYDRGVASFFRFHRGHAFASSALMAPISKRFVREIKAFSEQVGIPLLCFHGNQREDGVAAEHSARLNHWGGGGQCPRGDPSISYLQALQCPRREDLPNHGLPYGSPGRPPPIVSAL